MLHNSLKTYYAYNTTEGEMCYRYYTTAMHIIYVNSKHVLEGGTSIAKFFKEFHATVNYTY